MAIETKQLHALSKVYLEAVYGGAKKEAPKDTRLTVTAADKKANTKAYQNYKAGNKAYKAADHLKNESLSNWREDLKEVPNYEQIPIDAKDRNKKIEEKKVKNSVKINPEMKEEAQVISEKEVDVKDTRRTVDAIRAYDKSKDASRDATYDSDEGKKGKAKKEKAYAKKERGEIDKDDPNWKKKKYHTGMHGESYEATKTKEVMGALKKRDLKTSVKKKIAADIVKKKGDTSKSDDRYAYESKLWDEFVEGYQRNPEADPRTEKQKRMDDPDRGINSPAFRAFMAAQQGGSKKSAAKK